MARDPPAVDVVALYGLADLPPQLSGPALVGVDEKDPPGARRSPIPPLDRLQRSVALPGKVLEGVLKHARAGPAGQLDRPVLRKGVKNEHLIRPVQALDAGDDVSLLVFGENDRYEPHIYAIFTDKTLNLCYDGVQKQWFPTFSVDQP